MSIEFISQSMYGQFQRCPHQFERRWVYGEIIPPGVAARRGSATHHAAELNHVQKVESCIDLSIEELQDAARDEYIRLVQERGVFIPRDKISEKNQLLADGLDAATRLTALYHQDLAPKIQPIFAEKRITMDVGFKVPLAGTIDVLTVNNWMPDLKTADKSKGKDEAEKSIQLTFYAALVNHDTGRWPSKLSLEILVNNKIPTLQSLETSRGPQDFEALLLRLELFLAQLEAGIFPPCDPSGWICSEQWCGYYRTCKYVGRRK